MATTLRSTAIRGSSVALALPDLDGAAVRAPAIAQAIANYNGLVVRLADAEGALEAAEDRIDWLDSQRIEARRDKVTAEQRLALAQSAQRDAIRAVTEARRRLDEALRDLDR